MLIGGPGTDVFSDGAGDDSNFAKDGTRDTISCGTGTDSASADPIDLTLGGDCETISTG